MDKDPEALTDAKHLLEKWAEDRRSPEILSWLKRGIGLLTDIVMGDFGEVYQSRAKSCFVAYRKTVLSEAEILLSQADSCELDSLYHWYCVMDIFSDSNLDRNDEFNACESRLLRKWLQRLWEGLSPRRDREDLKSEKQGTKLNSKSGAVFS